MGACNSDGQCSFDYIMDGSFGCGKISHSICNALLQYYNYRNEPCCGRISKIILINYNSDAPKTTFNETCCKEKGVPYECMGNCQPFTTRSMGTPKSVCDEHKETIMSCVYLA